MTWVLITAVGALAIAAAELVARYHRRSILARFAEPGTDLVPAAVSTLPEPDPDGWSSQVGWSAWRAWLDARHAAEFDAEPSIFTALGGDAVLARRPRLAIGPAPQRELVAS